MEEQIDTAENQSASEDIIPETRSNKTKTWIYRVICILLFAAGIVFFICYYSGLGHESINYSDPIETCALVAVLIIALCFFIKRTKISGFKVVALIIAGILLAANWYIYFRYIPKYGPRAACAVVKSDPRYASAIVQPQYYPMYSPYGDLIASPPALYEIEGNPFSNWGYLLNVVSDGKVTAWIAFDPATGKYDLFEEQPED